MIAIHSPGYFDHHIANTAKRFSIPAPQASYCLAPMVQEAAGEYAPALLPGGTCSGGDDADQA